MMCETSALCLGRKDSAQIVSAAAGMLPVASSRVTRQST